MGCLYPQIEAEEVSRTNEFVQLEFYGQELDDKVSKEQRRARSCLMERARSSNAAVCKRDILYAALSSFPRLLQPSKAP